MSVVNEGVVRHGGGLSLTYLIGKHKVLKTLDWAEHLERQDSTLGSCMLSDKDKVLVTELYNKVQVYSKLLNEVLYGAAEKYKEDY